MLTVELGLDEGMFPDVFSKVGFPPLPAHPNPTDISL